MPIERKIAGAFVPALPLLSAIGVVSYRSLVRLTDDAGLVAHTRRNIHHENNPD